MLAIQICFVLLTLFIEQALCREYFDLDQLRLKNGAVIVNVDADWGSDVEIVSLFIKNGATLKFDRKTSFPALAFRMLKYRLQRLAKAKGFVLKSEFNWDYSSFTFYFPKGFLEASSPSLWGEVFGQNEVEPIELENLKRDVLVSLRNDLNRKSSKAPMISLMSSNNSIYSFGPYGNEDDLASINEQDFNGFLRCYLNPLGAAIVISSVNKGELQTITKELEKNKPCFRDDRYVNENTVSFNVPLRRINYIKANWENSVLRIGFPSVACSNKDSFTYDLVQQLINEDKGVVSIGKSIYVANNCYIGDGTLEIVIGGLKKADMNEAVDSVLKRLSMLGKSVDDNALSLAKKHLMKKYSNTLSRRDDLIPLIGKMELLYGSPDTILRYTDKIDAVKLYDIRRVLSGLTEKNSYCVLIRLEG
jgi:predicted Zn-dependent peptidase